MIAPPTFSDLIAVRMGRGRSDAIRAAAALPRMLSMAGGLPAADTFPVAELTGAVDAVLAGSAPAALQDAPTEGVPAMREVLAARATVTGALAGPDRVPGHQPQPVGPRPDGWRSCRDRRFASTATAPGRSGCPARRSTSRGTRTATHRLTAAFRQLRPDATTDATRTTAGSRPRTRT